MLIAQHLKQLTRRSPSRTDSSVPKHTSSCLVLLPMRFTQPARSTRPLVRSYRTLSPLPRKPKLHFAWRWGGLLSVALALSSRTVGVTHHRVLWSPDFPLRSKNAANTWPSADKCILHWQMPNSINVLMRVIRRTKW